MKTLRALLAALCLVAGLATLSPATTTSTSLDSNDATLTWTITGVRVIGFPGISQSDSFSCDAAAASVVCSLNGFKVTFTGDASSKGKVTFSATSVLTGQSCTALVGSNDTATVSPTATLTTCKYNVAYNLMAYFPTTCAGDIAGRAFRLQATAQTSAAC